MFACIKTGVANLEKNLTIMYVQCGTNHVMVKQHTNNILREIKLDMAKRFYPMSRVCCYAVKSVVALPCPKH